MFKVNFDYEFQLFEPNYNSQKYLKYNQQWEFLYWLAGEKAPLVSCRTYPDKYLQRIFELTNNKPLIEKSKNFKYWNGVVDEEHKKLNSRIESTKFAIEKGFAHRLTTINQPPSFDGDYVIKKEGGLSGSSFLKNQVPESEDYICEPLLNRVFDFSTLFIDGKRYYYQCLIDERFQFKGFRVLNRDVFSIEMLQELFPDFNFELERKVDEIFNRFNIGGVWSIDSFLYEENGKVKLYLLSEINYRKTMGYCFVNFLKNFGNVFSKAEFLINADPKSFDGKSIQLSPVGSKFNLSLHYS